MYKTNLDISNRVYGIVGLGVLFLIGVMFGYIINGSDRTNTSIMTRKQCDDLSERIISAARNNQPDLIAQLNKVFSENCNGRNFATDAKLVQIKPEVKDEKLPSSTCEAIETLLKNELFPENDTDWQAHYHNSDVYNRLSQSGCANNRKTYQILAQREIDIARALDQAGEMSQEKAESTCAEIERVLLRQLFCADKYTTCMESELHVRDAQIYANLSERGCPENSEKYKNLAKQELDIARALTDDDIEKNEREATEMVETYKRLQMQQEAAKMIEKAKKLTNPAIDFIIQLEKIIEE